jgi:DNA-directed RNA polymerase specialized sigma24 family protein
MKADERDPANSDEVSKAIAELTTADLRKLQSFAGFRIAALGRLSRGQDYEDLLAEAMAATLDGRRSWRKNAVTFVNHLMAVMRSTSDNWATRGDQKEVVEAELYGATQEQDEPDDLLGAIEPTNVDQEERLNEKKAIEALEASVSDDPLASEVLSALQLGLKGQELKDFLEITEEQLRAATRKIGRHAQALQPRFAPIARQKE